MNINTPRLGLLAACMLGLTAAQAAATTIDWNNAYRNSSGSGPGAHGGEFSLVNANLNLDAYQGGVTSGVGGFGTDDSFQTFCVEYNEYIWQGHTVSYELGPAAVLGGVAGGFPSDTVSQGTAYLYSEFAAGTDGALAIEQGGIYDFSLTGRAASAGLLQEAIWFLEHEITLSDPLDNPFLFEVTQDDFFGVGVAGGIDTARADQGTHASYGVSAVNLENEAGTALRQDQLYVGTGASAPPAPLPDGGVTVTLFGLALLGLGTAQRLVRKKKS